MLIVTEGRAVSRETALAELPLGRARWRETGRSADDWRLALLRGELRRELRAELPAALAALTPAAVAARSVGAAERGSWLAAAVHLQAGLDRVHLPARGLLRLDDLEIQRFAAAFNAELGGPDLRLQALPGGAAVLSGLDAPAAITQDPANVLGADVRGAVPRGVEAAPLRALSGEIEMWLHEHPLNLERQRRGELPVSSFWLWGGGEGAAADAAASASLRAVCSFGGSDPWLRALARVVDPSREALAADFMQWQATGADRCIVAISAVRDLAILRSAWLDPARAALAARRIARLGLWVDGRILTLTSSSNWHYWRPAQHWLEFLP